MWPFFGYFILFYISSSSSSEKAEAFGLVSLVHHDHIELDRKLVYF